MDGQQILRRTFAAIFLSAVLCCTQSARAAKSDYGSAASVTPPPPAQTIEPGRRERVVSLHDPMLAGDVPTWYTPGYEERARRLQALFGGELRFSVKQLGIKSNLSLAVLDSKQYAEVEHQVPYPSPSVSGDPPTALMPATWTGGPPDLLPAQSDATPQLRARIRKRGLTWFAARERAYDLWGGHEFGHSALEAYGINPGTRWLNELIASYVLYSYLQQEHRDWLDLLDIVETGCHIERAQRYVSLDDFDTKYLEIAGGDVHNYLWYQGQFFERIKKVYARRGIRFLTDLRLAFPDDGKTSFASLGNTETLSRLDAIDPGWSIWANSLAALPRVTAKDHERSK